MPDGFDGNEVVRLAYHAYNLSLGVGLSKVAGKVFRIGHLGSLNELMVLTALSGAETGDARHRHRRSRRAAASARRRSISASHAGCRARRGQGAH